MKGYDLNEMYNKVRARIDTTANDLFAEWINDQRLVSGDIDPIANAKYEQALEALTHVITAAMCDMWRNNR